MKRWITLFLTFSVLLLLCSCSNSEEWTEIRTFDSHSMWYMEFYEDAVEQCDRIVYGTVKSKSKTYKNSYHFAFRNSVDEYYRYVELDVEECLMGEVGDTVTFIELGGIEDGIYYQCGTPSEIGDKILVFLYPNGLSYFTQNPFEPYKYGDGTVIRFYSNMLPDRYTKGTGRVEFKMTMEEYLDIVRADIAVRNAA